jgi:hypothetical protein
VTSIGFGWSLEASSVAAAPEPVFLKTDHCVSNKNVKFSKIFTYIVLILPASSSHDLAKTVHLGGNPFADVQPYAALWGCPI